VTRPDLVVFDCDGILVDTERLTVLVESRVLGELGWPMAPEEVVERWMGRSSQAQIADLVRHLGADRAREFDERTTAELHETFDRERTALGADPSACTVLEDSVYGVIAPAVHDQRLR
jgi:beta-phosphoglucomutase-like phosphatase (HAD superfamily)